MNIKSSVEKQNRKRAYNLYAKERSKTLSEQYLDYFKTLNSSAHANIDRLAECIQNYTKRGDSYAAQISFIVPHLNVLRAYSKIFEALMANLTENITAEKDGVEVTNLLKMRDAGNLDVFFDCFSSELKFVDLILSGAFDVVTPDVKRQIVSQDVENQR